MRVFVHGAAATPDRRCSTRSSATARQDVTLYHLHTDGPAPFADAEQRRALPLGVALRRRAAAPGHRGGARRLHADLPLRHPALFSTRANSARRRAACSCRRPTRTATARSARRSTPRSPRRSRRATSSPRSTSGCRARSATRSSRSPGWPRSSTRIGRCTSTRPPPSPVEDTIGEHVAALVEDGATLQMGIGAIPDAVLRRLHGKHDLGVHTEMFSDGVIDSSKAGAITNRRKHVHRGRIVTSFVDRHANGSTTSSTTTRSSSSTRAIGRTTPRSSARTTRSSRSTRRSRSTSPARCAPTRSASASTPASAGRWTSSAARRCRRAASRSSRCPRRPRAARSRGSSRQLKPGAGVVTTRGHVHWVVTEYGAVNLFGLTLRERAKP